MKYAIIFLSLAFIASITYAFSIETDANKIIEQENRKKIISCMENVHSFTGSVQRMQKEIEKCAKLELQSIVGSGTITKNSEIIQEKVGTRESICKKVPTSPLCNKENFAMAQSIAYKKALIWQIEDKEKFFLVGIGIMNSESTLGTNYAGTCDSSYNNFGGIKWRIIDTGEAIHDQKIPQNGCYLYKFNTIEDYFGSKYNSLGKGYGSCFKQKDPVYCISFAYVGDSNVAEQSWQKNVNQFTK